MREGHLGQLPDDRNGPAEGVVPQQHRLHRPAEEVGQGEHIHVLPKAFQRYLVAIDGIELQIGLVSLGK